MAFLRFSRDKRGYEHFYLMQPTNRRGKSQQPRVLYWFRSPPNVRVGRQPFDDGVRRALETQNPGVAFDWKTIVETPIPSADTERWRERRRVDRAIRHAVAEDEAAETALIEANEDRSEAPVTVIEATAAAIAPVAAAGPAAFPGAGDAGRRRRRRRHGRRGSDAGRAPQPREAGASSEAPTPPEPAGPREPVED